MSLALNLAARMARLAMIGPMLARMKRNATRAAIGIGLVALLGGLALTYLLIALRYQLEQEIGPLWTPLAIGGGLAALALTAYLVFLRPRRESTAERATETAGAMPDLGAPIRNLESKVSKSPLLSLAIALAGGFAAASLLRVLRPRPRTGNGAAEPPGSDKEMPTWMRDALLRDALRREAERRKANGRGA